MTTPFQSHPLAFIQKVNSSAKLKRTINLDDIKEVLRHQHLLVTMNDRGLFIVLMTELIQHQFNLFLGRLKSLHTEICPPLKAIRKKREDRQDHPPKRTRRARVNTQGVNIEQIASESVSNPSHIQAQRVNRDGENKEESKGSKPSNEGQPVINIDFNAEMGEIADADMRMNFQHQIHQQSEQNSSGSQSTKMSSNMIPNLSEKLRVLGGDVSYEKRTIPKKRRGRQAGSTVRRKEAVVDLSIILDETKPTIDPRDLPVPVLREKCRALDLKKKEEEFEKILDAMTVQIKTNIFSFQTLRRLKDYEHLRRRDDQPAFAQPYFDIQTGNTMFDQQFIAPSTHFSGTQQQSNFNKSIQEHIDMNLFRGETDMTLSVLREKTKKPKEQIFMKLLWMAQRGEVMVQQRRPQDFGQITVKLFSV